MTKGTYAALKVGADTAGKLASFCEEYEIPNAVSREKLHSTLLFSHYHLPKYEPYGLLKEALVGEPTGWDVWISPPSPKYPTITNCLVLRYCSSRIVRRHHHLLDTHNGVHPHGIFRPHITLSYDVGDFDTSSLPNAWSLGPLVFVEEYGYDLELDSTNYPPV